MTTNRTGNSSTPRTILYLGPAVWALVITPLALLLLGVADSGRGRLFAIAALLTALLPLAGAIAWSQRTRRWIIGFVIGHVLWVVTLVLVVKSVPRGSGSGPPRLTHQFSLGHRPFSRYSPANLLPECDQLLLGFRLMTLIDPLLTRPQESHLSQLTSSLYRELEQDPEFRVVGSAMSDVYADVLGRPPPPGHAYVYVPAGIDRTKPRPVLVFFHGSGGNFKGYSWILSQLADQLGFVLVAPSNGMGNWREDESVRGLRTALEAAAQVAAIDPDRVHVLGLSNGGLAISQLAGREGSRLASMVFLSPVFDASQIRSASFAAQCRGRRLLVVSGSLDDRIPLHYVEENAARMRQAGAQVQLQTFATADHFLIFSHRPELLAALAAWYGPAR